MLHDFFFLKIAPGQKRERRYIQFITKYEKNNNYINKLDTILFQIFVCIDKYHKFDESKICRVTTLSRKWDDTAVRSIFEVYNAMLFNNIY